MTCSFCDGNFDTPSFISGIRSCLNCYVKNKRLTEKCCGPNCNRTSVVINKNRRYCYKCNTQRSRDSFTEMDVLNSIRNPNVPTNKYKIGNKIGAGSTGAIFKAIDRDLKTEVAIKKISEKEIKLKFIVDEVLFMSRIMHPNIIRFIEGYYYEKEVWIIMDLIPYNLHSVSAKIPFTDKEAAKVAADILWALKYLHERNFIHRDVKGGNVLMTSAGIIKLIDFGTSAFVTTKNPERKTNIGTAEFMVFIKT